MKPRLDFRRIAIIGAGNGGRALAAYHRLQGHDVIIWNRRWVHLPQFVHRGALQLEGQLSGEASGIQITDCLAEAVAQADLVMVVTTADAHRQIMTEAAPHLRPDAWVMLHPGRTGGALEVRAILDACRPGNCIGVCESQSLVFACRAQNDCTIRIIGIKDFVPTAALPAARTDEIVRRLASILPGIVAAPSVLHTSFENIGAVLHPAITLFNIGLIDRGQEFRFYADASERVTEFVERLDEERLKLGWAYGLQLLSLFDWIKKAYPHSRGNTLLERMISNPAYSTILGPRTFDARHITEDIPTGLVPYVSFGEAAGIDLPIMRSLTCIAGVLAKRDFWATGRTLARLGLKGATRIEIQRELTHAAA